MIGGIHLNRPSRKRLSIILITLSLLFVFFTINHFMSPNPLNEQPVLQIQPAFKLLEGVPISTNVTQQHGSYTVFHSKTGMKVTLIGSSLPNISSIKITSIYLGSAPPQNIPLLQLPGIAFYDLKVTLANGEPLESDIIAVVYMCNPLFSGLENIFYLNNKTWIPVETKIVETDTICGFFKVSQLSGTLIGVGDQPIFVVPEFSYGSLIAILACFTALYLHRIRYKQTFKTSS